MGSRSLRTVGNAGVATAIALVVLNLAHPFDGDTELYGDAVQFMSHMNTWWVIDHVAIGIVLLFVPWVGWAWVEQFQSETARVWGQLGWMTLLIGTLAGIVHVAGIDGVALPSFGDVLEASGNGPAEVAAASALMRVHLTTFMAWLITFWFGSALFLGIATLAEPDRRHWVGWILLVAAVLAMSSFVVTALEGQLTTLSEPFLFRPSTFLWTIWLLVAGLELRSAAARTAVSD